MAPGGPFARFPFNVTGAPAVSVPGGFSAQGLPIGLQIAAPHFEEPTLLQVAQAYEQAAGWHARKAATRVGPVCGARLPIV